MADASSDTVLLAASAVLFTALIGLAIIDWRTYRLPDLITLPLIAAGLAAAFLLGKPFMLHLAGAAFGYLAFVAIEMSYKRLRGRDGLGRGDAKLLAAGGAWCSVAALPVIVLIASFTALCCVIVLRLSGRSIDGMTRLAFGPFLAFAIGLSWYLQIVSPGFPLYL